MAELDLLDWRRRVAALYDRVRGSRERDPLAAHHDWCTTRDRLFARHPETPMEDPETFTGLRHAPYDPSFVFSAAVDTAVERERHPVGTNRLDTAVPVGEQRMDATR